MLVVIGPEWTGPLGKKSGSRIFNDDDPVRREVTTAIHRNIPLVPVLIRGSTLPSSKQIPDSLQKIRKTTGS